MKETEWSMNWRNWRIPSHHDWNTTTNVGDVSLLLEGFLVPFLCRIKLWRWGIHVFPLNVSLLYQTAILSVQLLPYYPVNSKRRFYQYNCFHIILSIATKCDDGCNNGSVLWRPLEASMYCSHYERDGNQSCNTLWTWWTHYERDGNQSCNTNCVLQRWRDKKEKEQVSIVSESEILDGAEVLVDCGKDGAEVLVDCGNHLAAQLYKTFLKEGVILQVLVGMDASTNVTFSVQSSLYNLSTTTEGKISWISNRHLLFAYSTFSRYKLIDFWLTSAMVASSILS